MKKTKIQQRVANLFVHFNGGETPTPDQALVYEPSGFGALSFIGALNKKFSVNMPVNSAFAESKRTINDYVNCIQMHTRIYHKKTAS